VLCVTVIEGVGNDWLSLGVIDGYHTPAAIDGHARRVPRPMTAAAGSAPFIDRYGRVPVLRACAAVALSGLLLVASAATSVAIAGRTDGPGHLAGFPSG